MSDLFYDVYLFVLLLLFIVDTFKFRKLPSGVGEAGTIQRLRVDYNDMISFSRHEVDALRNEIKTLRAINNKGIEEARKEARTGERKV